MWRCLDVWQGVKFVMGARLERLEGDDDQRVTGAVVTVAGKEQCRLPADIVLICEGILHFLSHLAAWLDVLQRLSCMALRRAHALFFTGRWLTVACFAAVGVRLNTDYLRSDPALGKRLREDGAVRVNEHLQVSSTSLPFPRMLLLCWLLLESAWTCGLRCLANNCFFPFASLLRLLHVHVLKR